MRRDTKLRVVGLAWLTFVWVMLWGTVSVANVLGGLAVAVAITFLLPLPAIPVTGRFHLLAFLRLNAVILYKLTVSSFQLA